MEKVSETYKNLYHYTTWEGLQGILKSRTLWATNFRFLNDESEIMLFMTEKLPKIILPILLEKFSSHLEKDNAAKLKFEAYGKTIDEVAYHDTEVMIKAQFFPIRDQIYITSFCGENIDPYINQNGLLSQWRAYGAQGGYAIQFDTEELEESLKNEHNSFYYGYTSTADLVYSHDESRYKRELENSISILVEYVGHIIDNSITQEPKEFEKDAYTAFLNCVTRYKHRGFSEENEVRIVCHPLTRDLIHKKGSKVKKDILFREYNQEKIPYISLFEKRKPLLPIKKIIVGPQEGKERKQAYLKTLLRDENIEITVSDIPYVGK